MKFMFTMLMSLLGLASLSAQTNVGVVAQSTFSTISTPFNLGELSIYKSLPAFSGGVVVEQEFGNHFAIESGAFYIPKGFMLRHNLEQPIFGVNLPLGVRLDAKMNYIQVPLLFKGKFGNDKVKAILKAGPRLSYATHGRLQARANLIVEFNVLDVPIPLGSVNRWDAGAIFGTGVEFNTAAGIIGLEASYDLGLTDLASVSIIDVPFRTQAWNIGASYKIPF